MSSAFCNQFPTLDHAAICVKVKIREVDIETVGYEALGSRAKQGRRDPRRTQPVCSREIFAHGFKVCWLRVGIAVLDLLGYPVIIVKEPREVASLGFC
jgi:hypothetical protein